MQMRESIILSPDTPGQAYLFQGPEISELSRLRGHGSPALLNQLIKMMHNVFFLFGEDMEDEYDWGRKIDEYELEEEMKSYAEMVIADYEFDDDKMWSMIKFLSGSEKSELDPGESEDDSLRDVITTVIGSGPPSSENFRALYDQLKKAEQNVVRFYVQANMGNSMEFNSTSVVQAWQEATRVEQAGNDGNDIFNDALAAFTAEYLQVVVESKDSEPPSYYYRDQQPGLYMEEELPSWLPEDGFLEALREHDRATDWYIDEHKDGYGGLQESSQEYIGERTAEYFKEKKDEWEHRFGFDIIKFLAPEYDPDDEVDPRRDVSLVQISEMAQIIADEGWAVKGGVEAAEKSSAIVFAIKELASQDETMKFVFSHDLNMLTWNPNDVMHGIEGLAGENSQFLFGPLADQVAQIKQRVEEQKALADEQKALADEQRRVVEEQERQERMRQLEEQKRIEEARHQMLPRIRETTTPEQLDRMRELGIAKRPFGHETELIRGTFPGAGPFKDLTGMMPFTMSIAPTKEYVDKGKIPPELMRNTLLHRVKTEGQPALGWLGGFADYDNKVLYIAEVQSDLMQRTGHMRDPQKVQKQREQEVATIQQQITDTQAKIQNVVSPKQNITQKLDAIRQENMALPPDNPKLQRNQGIIDNLLRQLPNVPDTVDTRNLELTLQNLNQSLVAAQQRLEESINAEDTRDSFTPKYRPWHDYKSKIENTFKEWIPIFFNAAFRMARDKGYTSVRIITADNLMGLWDKYAKPETRTLFERVYDQTAKFYGAQQINVQGKTWWEVIMTPDTRIASWLQRLTKTAQQHQWFMQDPSSGKFVWQIHLDIYFQKMQQHAPEMMGEQWAAQSTDYAANEGKRSVFEMWLTEVPSELKIGGGLEPIFKEKVRQYLIETQRFDPYEFEETSDDVEIPSADELNEWLG